MILTFEGNEFFRDREILLEYRANLAWRIPFLPYLPVMLTVEAMRLCIRNLYRELYRAKKWNLEHELYRWTKVRKTNDHMSARDPLHLTKRFFEFLKRKMLKDL